MDFAYILMGNYDSANDRTAMRDGSVQMYGVANLKEACNLARQLQRNGIGCIELCGAFGEKGAMRVIEATDHMLAVGYSVHFPEQHELFKKAFG